MSDQSSYLDDPGYSASITAEMQQAPDHAMIGSAAPLVGEIISPEPRRPTKKVKARRDPSDDPEWMKRAEAILARDATIEEVGEDGVIRSRVENGRVVIDWSKTAGRVETVIRNAAGEPMSILANAVDAIHNDPMLEGSLFFDDMRREIMTHGADIFPARPINDGDVIAITKHLQHEGMPKLSVGNVHDAVKLVASYQTRHPIREYLDRLTWDGQERLPTFFPEYFATDDNEYTRTIGRMMMLAAVKRIYDPGCKCDYAVVLESPQGHNKSTVLSILAGEEYFLDNLPRLDHKDSSSALRGKWFVEIAELSTMRKSQVRYSIRICLGNPGGCFHNCVGARSKIGGPPLLALPFRH
jgi:hypothetical protein